MLPALGLLAPSAARAGCSHLVTSRLDAARRASLDGSLVRDLAGPSNPLPPPSPHRPCSGAWCSGQPAVPPVAPGTFDGRLGSWAWHAPGPDEDSTAPSYLVAETPVLSLLRRVTEVFHPPRLHPPI
jgi:hypothetical protein